MYLSTFRLAFCRHFVLLSFRFVVFSGRKDDNNYRFVVFSPQHNEKTTNSRLAQISHHKCPILVTNSNISLMWGKSVFLRKGIFSESARYQFAIFDLIIEKPRVMLKLKPYSLNMILWECAIWVILDRDRRLYVSSYTTAGTDLKMNYEMRSKFMATF
jgi:hypothetical protein